MEECLLVPLPHPCNLFAPCPLLTSRASLRPYTRLPHRHIPATGMELLPTCVSLRGCQNPLAAPLYLAREPTARLPGVLCMNCFYRVCLDQQSKRNSTSSDRTRLRWCKWGPSRVQHTAEIKEKAPCLTKTNGGEVCLWCLYACKSLSEVKPLQDNL